LRGFSEFWLAYPKKVAKQDAEDAWAKLAPDAELQATILRAVEVNRRSRQWQEGARFIPNPATFLNGRRFDDELETPTGAAGERPFVF
jgi:hypothetical protein